MPVCKEIVADLLTPVSAFLKIAEHADYAFLLESVEGGEHVGRYSFLGKDPFLILRSREGRHDHRAQRQDDRERAAVHRHAAPADGRLPVAVRAGPAAVHRRRGRVSRLRRLVVVRAGARRSGRGHRRRGRCGVHAVRHGARLRSRPAPDPDHRERADHAGRRPRIALPVRVRQDSVPRARARAQPVAPALGAGTAARDPVQLHAGAVRGAGADGQGAHRGGRHLSGRAVAALRGRGRRRSVHGLPRAAAREPVALHVFHPHGRRVGRRLVARDAGARRGIARRDASDRGHAAARPQRRRRHAARRGAEAQREGARRARDARGPGPQRRRPRVRVRIGARAAVHGPRALLARHASDLDRRGAPGRRPRSPRRAGVVLPGGHRVRRAEGAGDADHQRARARARAVCGRGRLSRLRRQPRLLHRDPHRHHVGREGLRAGGRRDRDGLEPGGRIRRNPRQGARALRALEIAQQGL